MRHLSDTDSTKYHEIKEDQIKLYHFAYEDSERQNGYFVDVKQDIEEAESHIFINGWAVEDIKIGKLDEDDVDERPLLSRVLLEKSVSSLLTESDFPPPLIVIQSWNHLLDGGESNQFGAALKKAAKAYYLEHEHEILALPEDSEKRKILENLKNGILPINLVWRANSGKRGELTNSNHQKSVCIDSKVAYVGGIDLANGRDVLPGDPVIEGQPVFRDGMVRINNPELVKDIENSSMALFLSKTRAEKIKVSPSSQTRSDAKINQYVSQQINTIIENQSQTSEKIEEDAATCRLLRTVPRAQLKDVSIERNPNLDSETKEVLQASIPDANTRETSIKEAYRDAIENAEGYIYIENQNFTTATLDTPGTVPRAILDKILYEHEHGNDFHVYLTLPRYPVLETDDPTNNQVKYLAMAQKDTITELCKALKKAGIDPKKYITISTQVKVEETKQAQVYNHSKFIITKESCIQGSCNITDRSMEGKRDSEHAIQVVFNEDKYVKEKYTSYLSKLITSNMGPEFFEINIDTLNELGIIVLQEDSEYKIIDPDAFLSNPQVRELWQTHLIEIQRELNTSNGLVDMRILPLAHDYFKRELLPNEPSKRRRQLVFSEEDRELKIKTAPETPQVIRSISKKGPKMNT
jgi:phosphatidylserine/phosphatidylglycerophosphate/cardiolipin synthase-like enzyme